MTKKRKQFSPEKKISILREHLVEKISVSDVCDKHGLKPSVFYVWQKKLFENGADVLVSGRIDSAEKKLSHQVEVLGDKLKQLSTPLFNPDPIRIGCCSKLGLGFALQ